MKNNDRSEILRLNGLGRAMAPSCFGRRRRATTLVPRRLRRWGLDAAAGDGCSRSALPPLGPGRHAPALAGACRLVPVRGFRFPCRALYRCGVRAARRTAVGSAPPRAVVGPLGQALAGPDLAVSAGTLGPGASTAVGSAPGELVSGGAPLCVSPDPR